MSYGNLVLVLGFLFLTSSWIVPSFIEEEEKKNNVGMMLAFTASILFLSAILLDLK